MKVVSSVSGLDMTVNCDTLDLSTLELHIDFVKHGICHTSAFKHSCEVK